MTESLSQLKEERAALLEALKRLMAAERAVSKADREALVAMRFESPDLSWALNEQTRAGHEITAAWGQARAVIAEMEGREP